jgi:hypothetical protein
MEVVESKKGFGWNPLVRDADYAQRPSGYAGYIDRDSGARTVKRRVLSFHFFIRECSTFKDLQEVVRDMFVLVGTIDRTSSVVHSGLSLVVLRIHLRGAGLGRIVW